MPGNVRSKSPNRANDKGAPNPSATIATANKTNTSTSKKTNLNTQVQTQGVAQNNKKTNNESSKTVNLANTNSYDNNNNNLTPAANNGQSSITNKTSNSTTPINKEQKRSLVRDGYTSLSLKSKPKPKAKVRPTPRASQDNYYNRNGRNTGRNAVPNDQVGVGQSSDQNGSMSRGFEESIEYSATDYPTNNNSTDDGGYYSSKGNKGAANTNRRGGKSNAYDAPSIRKRFYETAGKRLNNILK